MLPPKVMRLTPQVSQQEVSLARFHLPEIPIEPSFFVRLA